MTVTLHHLEQSRSQRILWLLEELDIPGGYEIKTYKRENGLAPKELREIHPLGKSPVIVDGDLVVAESAVIVDYLIRKYGNGRFTTPEGDEQKALDNLYFQHFAEGSLMPPLVMKLVFSTMVEKSPFFIRPISSALAGQVTSGYIDPNLKKMFALIDSYLAKDGGRKWLAGTDEPTAADFLMSFPLETAVNGGRMDTSLVSERIREYVQRVQSRPAYTRGLEKGPDYKYGPKNKL
ncbi:thioredoxin-like protein [Cystobasidium minutum MCA 4210]|uniref:thioredoxin-like protein n=1 Tax=Cystobasidium minutum MCA 4210 TaxID=1397322 RepID=UPI0034CD6F6D|eukprot:jgi/Rhomi1/89369/CE89368_5984